MTFAKKTPFEQAAGYLGGLKPRFANLPRRLTDAVREIRIRAGRPIVLECTETRVTLPEAAVTTEQTAECVREFCGFSVHSCEKQLREGWLTLAGGHRAGFCGTAVLKDGKVSAIRDVSSINLRIARQFVGSAEDLYARISNEEVTGLLIIGKPMSAKTTVLRDLCRLLSQNHKVALIDERGEIAAVHNGIPTLDVGGNTDVLDGFPKADGFMTALRSLSPEYVLCDETGGETERRELLQCANSGVKLILTAHGGGIAEAYGSRGIRSILAYGGISHLAVLGTDKNIGKTEYYGTNKLFADYRGGNGGDFGDGGGAVFLLPTQNARTDASGACANAVGNVLAD